MEDRILTLTLMPLVLSAPGVAEPPQGRRGGRSGGLSTAFPGDKQRFPAATR
jgi:hypothetical protein